MPAVVTLLKSAAVLPRRWILAISSLISGHQHNLGVYLWSAWKKAGRDQTFARSGVHMFQLMLPDEWRAFGAAVDRQMRVNGAGRETKSDWALNKRVYVDPESEGAKVFVDRIKSSAAFRDTVTRLWGGDDWEIYSTQIWRNHAEPYRDSRKEINSTYYHVDNGGPARNRLLINLFMYLTEVAPANGPFTYYNREESAAINRRFAGMLFSKGNLRAYDAVESIETAMPPHQLMLKHGEGVLIDNQICLHRAGFCTEGHRDIIEIVVAQQQ